MIPYGDIRKSAPASDTSRDRASRRRAAAVFDLFGGPAGQKGAGLDFSTMAASAAPSSNMGGSVLDLYGSTAFKADIVQRDERNARMDRLPASVQKLATEGVTDLHMLEAVAIISRACKAVGGNPAQCFYSDIGKAIGVTTFRAEEILREAAQLGFIEPRAGSYWRCKL